MATTDFPWMTGWTPDAAPRALSSTFAPRQRWRAAEGIRRHLTFSDSGLAAATGGLIGAQYVEFVETGGDTDSGWHFHDLDWQFFMLLDGTMCQETEPYGALTIRAGDSGCYPGFLWHRESRFSAGCTMLALRVPAKTVTTTGREHRFPEREASVDPDRAPVYSFDRPDAYAPGEGLESDFEVRDLGTVGPTAGRIRMRVIRAARRGAAIGWHYDTASTWMFGLSGHAAVEVEPTSAVTLARLDALSIAPGSGARHRISHCSEDFAALEMTFPAASHEVVAVAPPDSPLH